VSKDFLEQCLAQGLSLNTIGELTGKDASTVGYWVAKHGLEAVGRRRYAPRGGLTREQLLPLIAEGLSIRELAARLDRSTSTVLHWLKRHDLETERAARWALPASERPQSIEQRCSTHGVTTFVATGAAGHYRCRQCRAERVAARRRAIKLALVEEAGGCCKLCGYDRSVVALQFHHVNPATKEFHIALGGVSRSLKRARAEASKCVLLCANCHAEVEAGITSLPLKYAASALSA
jgi:5-methylcytosine-specific restriction endonuclease McrA